VTPLLPTRLVLDTDVASFLFNLDPVRAPRYRAHTDGRTLFLPFVVVAEMRFGAEIRGWGSARKEALEAFFRSHAVIESAPDISRTWAAIRAQGQRSGRTIERQDAWIAAVAVALDLPLVTHNADHFANVRLLVTITEPDG